MAVSATGELVVGVPGGCVDAAVYTLCEQAIVDGHRALARFGPNGDGLPDQLLDRLLEVGPRAGEWMVAPLVGMDAAIHGERGLGRPLAA